MKWQADVDLALPGVLAAAREPGVELHTFGGYFGEHLQEKKGPIDRPQMVAGLPYHYHALTQYYAYQRDAGILDIAAVPLRPDLAFNRGRSGQKWMEMALHSTATVLQRLEPYWQAEEEVTCLKADAPEEWQDQLLRLVRDPALRRRIGESARRSLWEALVTEVSDRWLTAPEKRHDPLEDIVTESNNAPEVSG